MNNKFWREIFDQVTSLVMIFRMQGGSAELMFVNKAVHDHLGYTPEDFVLESEQDGDLKNNLGQLVQAAAKGVINAALTDMTGSDVAFHVEIRTFFSDAIKEDLAILTLQKEPEVRGRSGDDEVVAESIVMKSVMERIRQLEEVGANMAFIGGTGTGKRFFMDRVQRDAFGHGDSIWKIDYSGAKHLRVTADGVQVDLDTLVGTRLRRMTTILVYNLDAMPKADQLKLSRFLEAQESPCRFVCGSEDSPDALVASGSLAAELYYKMNLISVVLPALDMRRADIKPYSERWLKKVCDAVDVDLPSISDKEWTRLFHHEYAGGYDELNAILMRSLINGSSGKFQFELSASQTAEKKARSTRDSIDGSITLSNGATYDEHMREYLEQMMIRHGWKIYGSDGAAVQLGMKPTTLQSKLEKYSVRKR